MSAPKLEGELPKLLSDLMAQARDAEEQRRSQGIEYTPVVMRANLDEMIRRFVTRMPSIEWVQDTSVTASEPAGFEVPVRLYHPRPNEPLPVLVFAHGGGHMAGSVNGYDPIARKLADASGWLVASVDYRLAPECPYPMGLNDLVTVVRGIYATLDRLGVAYQQRLAMAGDSGGAAITASAAHRLVGESGVDIERQVLIYPSLDYTMSCESIDTLARGYLLERDRIAWLFDRYFQQDEDRQTASPLFMPLSKGFPRTFVLTAGYCPLRDEGFAYVERLQNTGIAVTHRHEPDMVHAFLNLEDVVPETCAICYDAIGHFLNAD